MLILSEPERDLRDRFERGVLGAVDLQAHPVVERWARVRALRALGAWPPGSDPIGLGERVSRASPLVARANDVLELVSSDLNRRGLAVLLADRDGVVLTSRGVDAFGDRALRTQLGDGGSMSEAALGTNAVGTALAEGTAVTVIGPAHYEPAAQQLCCYAAPIRDATDRVVAVLDISGPREAADPLFGILVQSLAGMLESRLPPEPLQLVPVLETLPVAVWVSDADGNIALSNHAARRLWGGELKVPIAQYDRFKAWWPDGRRLAPTDWGLARALRSGEVMVDEDVNIETFDGLHKVIRNLAAPIVDDAGRIVGGVAVNEDVTLERRAEATRDRFSAVLGHDLRNPLNAITMSAKLLLERGGLANPQAQAVSRIQSSAGRIQDLVDDLLDFTRARFSMGFPIEPVPADMGEIVGTVVDEIRAANPGRAIRLDRRGNTRGVWDPARVAQVVSNLVANAVEHGRDPLAVQVDDAGDAVTVSVSNGGAPISTAKLATLFEPFRRGDASKGIGLGLFIAREIVRSHGGTIDVASGEEETLFTTRWPRQPRD